MLKLGKAPARPGAVKFKLADYMAKLPKVPLSFGHEKLVPEWGMLGNDSYGDCVFAGAAHETMLWLSEGGKPYSFGPECVLKDYSAVTGFDTAKPDTDQGTDMELAAKYRRQTGIQDLAGNRHQVGAYLALTPGDLKQALAAAYIFGAVGIGIEFPSTAMDQFNAGHKWSVVKGSRVEGGHYVPLIAHRGDLFVVTWGKVQKMTEGFFKKYCDEAIVYLSTECMKNGKTMEGFDLPALQADIAAL